MKKSNKSEIVKSIAVSILAIGILSTLFMGMNSLVFAAESRKTESITPIKEAIDIATLESALPKDYKKPSLTVYEFEYDYEMNAAPPVYENDKEKGYKLDDNAISSAEAAENEMNAAPPVYGNDNKNGYKLDANAISSVEAAEIGAQYIWEIFGEDIDGKTVRMIYDEDERLERAYWTGSVGDSESELEKGNCLFNIVIDAISGEKKNVQIFQDLPFADEEKKAKEPYHDNIGKYMEISIEYAKKRKERVRELYHQNSEEYMEIAKEAAQKHFKNSIVADAVYLEDRSNDGIVFMVTDDTGHEIDVAIYSETKQVESVNDSRDEIDSTFVPDPNAVG